MNGNYIICNILPQKPAFTVHIRVSNIFNFIFVTKLCMHSTENQGRGEEGKGRLTSVWDGNASQWVDSEYCYMIGEIHVYLLKWKQSVMTRELKYLDKTVMEPRGRYLIVLMKQRTSHSKYCKHFCNFFPREFLITVNAFELSA